MAEEQKPDQELEQEQPQTTAGSGTTGGGKKKYKIEEAARRRKSQQAPAEEESPIEGWMQYRQYIAGGLVILVGLIAGIYWWGEQQETKALEAKNLAFEGLNYYTKDSLDKALNTSTGHQGLKDIADEYGGTPTGNLSAYLTGTAYLQKGEYDQAISYLEKFDANEDLISASSKSALAAAYEGKGEFEKAAGYYEEAAEIRENSATSPFFLSEAARCYEEAGDNESALDILVTLRRKYPDSQQGVSVEREIYRLNGGKPLASE